ncbi:MAG: hypothetical protein J0I84_20200 [Terrimonas sp.]|nr:hypothetical protein [Terrimonas sp.]
MKNFNPKFLFSVFGGWMILTVNPFHQELVKIVLAAAVSLISQVFIKWFEKQIKK